VYGDHLNLAKGKEKAEKICTNNFLFPCVVEKFSCYGCFFFGKKMQESFKTNMTNYTTCTDV